MKTKITTASVKVMLSYNYNNFEASMTLEYGDGLEQIDIDNARKNCQRLCDKAIEQYKIAKIVADKRMELEFKKKELEREIEMIMEIPKKERTIIHKARIKALEDFEYNKCYDYEDDYEQC